MVDAQRRAAAPFEGELQAITLAIGAIERAGLVEGRVANEQPSFAGSAANPAPSRRGRRSRSTGDMILMALERAGSGMGVADIVQQLERRWNRTMPAAAVMLELQHLEAEGAVARGVAGWSRRASAPIQDTSPEGDNDIAKVA